LYGENKPGKLSFYWNNGVVKSSKCYSASFVLSLNPLDLNRLSNGFMTPSLFFPYLEEFKKLNSEFPFYLKLAFDCEMAVVTVSFITIMFLWEIMLGTAPKDT
jgi:hypothetical protein